MFYIVLQQQNICRLVLFFMWKREPIIRFSICLIPFVRLPILVSKVLEIFPGLCSLWWPCSTFMACSAFNNIQSRIASFSVIHKDIDRWKLSAIQAMPNFTATKIKLLLQERTLQARNRRGGTESKTCFSPIEGGMVKLLNGAGGRKARFPSSFHCLMDRLFLVGQHPQIWWFLYKQRPWKHDHVSVHNSLWTWTAAYFIKSRADPACKLGECFYH